MKRRATIVLILVTALLTTACSKQKAENPFAYPFIKELHIKRQAGKPYSEYKAFYLLTEDFEPRVETAGDVQEIRSVLKYALSLASQYKIPWTHFVDVNALAPAFISDDQRLKQECLALIGDSTNAVREGRSPSESEVAKCLADLIRTAPGRVAVTTFASNVARMRTVAEAAVACEREVVVVGRAMDRISQVARETGYLDGIREFRSVDVYGHLPPDKVLALCTGSQGEPRAALARIANNDHPQVTLNKGDSVIFSSRTIPGNEKAVNGIINGLVAQGVDVITDRTHLVHCLLYTSPSPRDRQKSRMPSSA